MPGRVINWNREKFAALKAAFDKAQTAGKLHTDTFKVELPGEIKPAEFVVGYAKHLIDYLAGEFAKHPDQPRQRNDEGEEGQ